MTVSGVAYTNDGRRLSGGSVIVLGKTPVVTNALGEFTVPAVTAPYDVALVVTALQRTYVTLVYGLTRSDPALVAFDAPNPPAVIMRTATVSGTVTGPNISFGAGRMTQVVFAYRGGQAIGTATASGFSFPVTWPETNTVTGTLYALQHSDNFSGLPTSYYGFGSLANVTLTASATLSNQNINAPAVTSNMFTGMLAPGYLWGGGSVVLNVGLADIRLHSANQPPFTTSYNVPEVTNATIAIAVSASPDVFFRYRGISPSNTMVIPLNPGSYSLIGLPINHAMGINLATQFFTWSPAGLPSIYDWLATCNSPQLTLRAFTAGQSVRLPSTSSLGLGTLSGQNVFNWSVRSHGGLTTTDGLTEAHWNSTLQSATGPSWEMFAGAAAFTTQ